MRHARDGPIRTSGPRTCHSQRCSISVTYTAVFLVVLSFISLSRPEKDHAAQLRAFQRLIKAYPEYAESGAAGVKLVLLGGCRNSGDAARVEGLRRLSEELGIQVCPAPF